MKEPEKLKIKAGKTDWENSISCSHLEDTKKCHIMVMNYGELTSASLTKSQVMRLVKWLNKWLKFKEYG